MQGILSEDNVASALHALDVAVERFKAPMVNARAFQDHTLSIESRENRLKFFLKRIRDAVVRAYQYVVAMIQELVSGYTTRLNRFHDELTVVENTIRGLHAQHRLDGAIRGFIDDLSIGNRLYVSGNISFASVDQAHTTYSTLLQSVPTFYEDVVKTNRKVIQSTDRITDKAALQALIGKFDVPAATRSTTQLVGEVDNVAKGSAVTASKPLPGNTTLLFVSAPADAGVPWVDHAFGLHYVSTVQIDKSDRRLLRTPVLTGAEIRTLVSNTRRTLQALRAAVDQANRANRDIRLINKEAESFTFEPGTQHNVQELTATYLARSIRNSAGALTGTMSRGYDFIFGCLLWVRKSLSYYQKESQ